MNGVKKVIALTGSTRGLKTASDSMINYLAEKLEGENINLKKFRAYQVFKEEKQIESILGELEDSELILICSPVYVHSLPYPLISLMEQMAEKTGREFWKGKKMVAIIHNGYPEDIQRKAAITICENFAHEMGMEWLGGIGFGGSPIIDGRPLEEVGGFTKWMRKALDDISKSIKTGKGISEEARRCEKKHFPSIPLWILKIMLNLRLKSNARKNEIDLYARPYVKDREEF